MCDLYSDIRKNADWYAELGSGKIVVLLLLLNQKQPAKRKFEKHVNKYEKYILDYEGIFGHFDHKIWWKLFLCRMHTLIKYYGFKFWDPVSKSAQTYVEFLYAFLATLLRKRTHIYA